ncbi:MAG: AbrB family transcriptional regulator, partial [Alphaproteobacteria bacterium]
MNALFAAFTWPRLGWALVTLALGTAGGFVFAAIGMPAAFLSGPMVAVALCAVLRVPVDLPMPLRDIAFVVLGAILGTTMDQETLTSLQEWPISIAGLLIGLVALMTVVPRYLTRFHSIDSATAKLCAIPGALGVVVVLASELDVDARRVAILHTLRLAVLLTLIPATVALAFNMEAAQIVVDGPDMSWSAAALVLVLCFLIVPPARLLRFPAPTFVAPMFLTGGLSMSGLVQGQMPLDLLWPALIVSGAVVGAKFAGTTLRYLIESIKAGLGGITLAIAITGFLAWPVAWLTGMPFVQIWLAYAPGGFDAMPVLAFSLGLDPTFVAGHQLIRFLAI